MFDRFKRKQRSGVPGGSTVTFDKLTARTHKVVALAQEEARHFNHNYIGTEHLLLGLLREDEGAAPCALGFLSVTLDEVREQVESIVGYGEEATGGQAPFTPRSKKVLELALSEALQLGHNHIGTEHVLLGLVRESEGVAARVLSNLDVDPDKVRREVVRMLDKAPKPDPLDLVESEVAGNKMLFRTQVQALEVHARCGVSDEERALPQALLVDLDYTYEGRGEDDVSGMVDYGVLLEGVARLLEGEEFKLLETGARRVGDHTLNTFPAIEMISVSVTKLRVPVARSLSGVSVSATFRR